MPPQERFTKKPPLADECYGFPYTALSNSQRDILQLTADGLGDIQIGERVGGRSVPFVSFQKSEMSWFGTPIAKRTEIKRSIERTMFSLILDGINQGYIEHELKSDEEVTISRTEQVVLDLVSEGINLEVFGMRLGLSKTILDSKYRKIAIKLGTTNRYHTVARATELKRRGLLAVVPDKPKRHH